MMLPLDAFWELEDLIKRVNYLTAAAEDPVVIMELWQKTFRKASRYCVNERDRNFINEKLKGSSEDSKR